MHVLEICMQFTIVTLQSSLYWQSWPSLESWRGTNGELIGWPMLTIWWKYHLLSVSQLWRYFPKFSNSNIPPHWHRSSSEPPEVTVFSFKREDTVGTQHIPPWAFIYVTTEITRWGSGMKNPPQPQKCGYMSCKRKKKEKMGASISRGQFSKQNRLSDLISKFGNKTFGSHSWDTNNE